MQQFVPRSRVRICRNECTRSTPLAPKLMFCFVPQCLVAFGTVPLLYETRFKTSRTVVINAKVQATKLRQNILLQIHLSTPCFGAFHSVWVHLGPFRYCMKLGAKWAELMQLMQKFMPQSCIRIFCNKSTLSTPCFGAFHSVWVHLGPFRYCIKLGAKWVEVVQLIQKFVP